MKSPLLHVAAMALVSFGLSVFPARAITFTLDSPSASAGGVGDTLYNPGPVTVVPGTGVEVDAISYGRLAPIEDPRYYFSVSPGSVGAPGSAVAGESPFFDEAADIYVSTGGGINFQFRDGNGIVANPATPGAPSLSLGLIEPMPGADNVDGLDLRVIGPMIYWSVDPTTAAGAYGGAFTAADIFMAATAPGYSGVPALYASASLLGLLAGDDIDAMVYFEDGVFGATPGDVVLFSLAPGSTTLGTLGASAADILITSPGGGPAVHVTAAALGLLATDNLDALDVVPEPGQWMLLGTALFGFAMRRRRA